MVTVKHSTSLKTYAVIVFKSGNLHIKSSQCFNWI